MVTDFLDILTQFGAGPGGDPGNLAVRFLLAAFFWLVLAVVAFRQWRLYRDKKDRLLLVAAAIGCSREIFMFVAEYGARRGHLDLATTFKYYPPAEHSLTMLASILLALAFIRYYLGDIRFTRLYLLTGVLVIGLLYAATAPCWISFLAAHPTTKFGAFWGDMAFRVTAAILLAVALGILVKERRLGASVPSFLLAGLLFLFFDEFLMIFNLATDEIHLDIYAPIRHNLHIWAIPFFIAVYWDDLQKREHESRNRAENLVRDLTAGKARLRELFNNLNSGVAVFAAGEEAADDFILVDCNSSTERLERRQKAELAGMKACEIFPQACENGLLAALHLVWETGVFQKRHVIISDGQKIDLWREHYLFKLATGELVVIFEDLTQQKNVEAQLRSAQKMEAIGTLAGGIAHDFNNILSAILGYADLLADKLPPASEEREDLGQIQIAGRRAVDLVRQILTFSRKTDQEIQPLALQLVLKETLKLLRGSLPSTITIRQRIDPHCGLIKADLSQMHQVIMNLCTNAYHAMREKGGVLEVELAEQELDCDLVERFGDVQSGRYVCLQVKDSGCGMDEMTRKRIFEPFFTTKQQGEGTGLGLAVVFGIVTGHCGAITVESVQGQGTTFAVYFPLAGQQGSGGIMATAENDCLIQGIDCRVMLVDDEQMLLDFVVRGLVKVGCQVTSFGSSENALAAFMAEPNAFDVVVTDQTMPGLTGIELTRQIRAVRPDLPVIMCTGYSENITEAQARAAGVSQFFLKPVPLSKLAEGIQAVV